MAEAANGLTLLTGFWNGVKPFGSHAVTALVSVVVTAVVTYFLALRRFRKEEQHKSRQRQLDELYGPLAGLIKQVQANANAYREMQKSCQDVWQEISQHHPRPFLDSQEQFEPFKRAIENETKRFQEQDLQAYQEMLDLLKAKNHLAYPTTLEFLDMLTQFVAHRTRPMPLEVRLKLIISEKPLLEFYAEVEKRCKELKEKLSGGQE